MVDNPNTLQFTPSPDHSTLTRYDMRTVRVSDSAVLQITSIGLPTPVSGVCSIQLNLYSWVNDTEYRVELRSVRGSAASAWVAATPTARVTEAEAPTDVDIIKET